jgi:phosphopantothenate---cysteine ligase (CTP)
MARVLLSSGGTREPIDEVRFISNVSTGSTGAALASALAALGHTVHLLHGQGASLPADRHRLSLEGFSSTQDLLQRFGERLRDGAIEAVIMCAAVADYTPKAPLSGKIRSDAPGLTLELVRTPKILPQLKGLSPRPLLVIGFKLTVGASPEAQAAAVSAQFTTGGVDAVVHNDLAEIRSSPVHPFHLHLQASAQAQTLLGTSELARALDDLLRKGCLSP